MSKAKNRRRNKSYRQHKVNELKGENSIARKHSRQNTKEMFKPRKEIQPSFIAKFDGDECPRCFLRIEKGQRVRYNEDDLIVHVIHRAKEIEYDICDRCFLAKPCDCDT